MKGGSLPLARPHTAPVLDGVEIVVEFVSRQAFYHVLERTWRPAGFPLREWLQRKRKFCQAPKE